jgi:molybdate transport system substrate-binding protein
MTAVLAALLFLLSAGIAPAAEVKVLGSTGVRGILTELATKFEAATGHKVVPEYDVFAVLKRRIDAGENFDIAILSPALIEDLAKQNKVMADTSATVGRTGMGAAVPTGAVKPDISSVEAFKRTLLNAKSVGYPKEGASGTHFLALLDRLGLAEGMKPKLRPFEGGGPPAQALAAGEPELVIGGTTLFPAMAGAEIVGSLPPELQNFIVFTGAVSADAKNPEAAKALVRFLTNPEAAPVLKAKGMEPG